jgi:TonB family protein
MMLICASLICGALALLSPISSTAPLIQVSSAGKSVQALDSNATVDPLPIRLINPAFSQQVSPAFARKAKKTKMRGQIVLSIIIATDSTVKHVSVVSGNPEVVPAAVEAVERWRYLPAMRNGELVEATTEVTIQYDFSKDASLPDDKPENLNDPPPNLLQQVADGNLFRTGPGTDVTSPRALYAPDPQYSEEARRNKISGRVLLGVIVGADGKLRDVWVARSLGEGLDESSIAAIKKWIFSPATRNGEPVASIVNIETTFDIY